MFGIEATLIHVIIDDVGSTPSTKTLKGILRTCGRRPPEINANDVQVMLDAALSLRLTARCTRHY